MMSVDRVVDGEGDRLVGHWRRSLMTMTRTVGPVDGRHDPRCQLDQDAIGRRDQAAMADERAAESETRTRRDEDRPQPPNLERLHCIPPAAAATETARRTRPLQWRTADGAPEAPASAVHSPNRQRMIVMITIAGWGEDQMRLRFLPC
jgi:hypothetical protein